MKKLLALTLALVLCLALTVPALAADTVVPSPQSLVFDGYGVEDFCAYNINGYNYFKLRDIAALMSGTAGEFAVDYDADTNVASITTGGSYVYVGGELEKGADQSATAVPSPQTVLINGEACDTLSVYNIGGNNYFKLRDLGEALGFAVDYDEDWNAAIVTPPHDEWLMVSEKHTGADGNMTITFTYNDAGQLTGYAASDGSTNSVYTYNAHGVAVNVKSFGGQGEDAWENESTYTGSGKPLSEVSRYGDSVDTTTYTYNDRGILTAEKSESTHSDYSDTHEYVYDDRGSLLRHTDSYSWSDGTSETGVTTYTCDEQGRILRVVTEGSGISAGIDWDESSGEWIDVLEPFSYVSETTTVYDGARSTSTEHTVYTYADGTESVNDSVSVVENNADGNPLSQKYTVTDNGETYVTEIRCTYDEAGRLLTEAQYSDSEEAPAALETYTYDADGRLLSDRREDANGDYTCMTYTYDADGNCIADSYEELYTEYDWETDTSVPVLTKTSGTYTFDAAGRPTLYVSDSEGEHYERALTYDANGNLTRETVRINGKVTETIVYTYQRTT